MIDEDNCEKKRLFKHKNIEQAVLAALLAVAVAAPAPGGLTGLVLDHGLGPIHAPRIVSHAPIHSAVHIVAQPVAPVVHAAPIITKTIIPSHGPIIALGHGYGPVHGSVHGLY